MKNPLFNFATAFCFLIATAFPVLAQKGNPKPEKITFLGVVAPEVADSLRQHLELPEGFGLQVEHVLEDSPAGKVGLKSHDVLTKLDDQLLTTSRHLALLVRMHKPGDKVDLTYVRKGKEETVSIALGEMDAPDIDHFRRPNPEQWQDAMRGYQDDLNQWLQQNGRSNPPVSPNSQGKRYGAPKGGGKPPSISVRPGFPIQVFGAKGVVKIDNGQGEVTITEKEDKHEICVKDEEGEIVFEGDYDPEKGTEGLPKEAQDHLHKMKLDDLKVLTPRSPILKSNPETDEEKGGEIEKISEPVPAEVRNHSPEQL